MEVASVAGQLAQQALREAGTSAAPKPAAAASPEAVAGLEEALNRQPDPAGPQTGQADFQIDGVAAQSGAEPEGSLGERILGGLEKMSQSSGDALEQARSAVSPQGEVSPADLLKAQYALMQVSIQQDVTSKVAGKATQTLDSLLKNQ